MSDTNRHGIWWPLAVLLAPTLFLSACGSFEKDVALGALGVTAYGASSPNNEIEQIYYFGVFDRQEQLPPQVYRVRVHGQASFISLTRFASGWAPANVIDALGTNVDFDDQGNIQISKADSALDSPLDQDRKLVLFGPEGFRESPKGHRLVIVMGSNPEGFFQAMDESLGVVAEAIDEQRNTELGRMLFEALARIEAENDRLDTLARDVDVDLPAASGAGQ